MCKEKITVDGQCYILESSINVMAKSAEGLKPVLIRSRDAGVHFGLLAKEEFTSSGKVVVLKNTRRVWYWDGAASLSQMALEGVSKPTNCKFSVVVAENEIVNVIETIPLTEKAFSNLSNVFIWKQ